MQLGGFGGAFGAGPQAGAVPTQPVRFGDPKPDSVFDKESEAGRLLVAWHERYKKGGAAAADPDSVHDAVLRPRTVFRRLDPQTLKDAETTTLDALDDEVPLNVNRNTAPWDSAFALAALFEDRDDSGAAVPPPLVYHLAYMLATRCVQCGECEIQNAVMLTRGKGTAHCRRFPLCPRCIVTSRLLGRMVMAQAAVPPHPLRGDDATRRYLQDADAFVINDPYLIEYIANCDALAGAHTIRFTCVAPDIDLRSIARNAPSLRHLAMGGNCVGHPDLLGELLKGPLASLESLEICTGVNLSWTLEGIFAAQPAHLKELRITRHRSRNDQTDAWPLDVSVILDALCGAAALPALESFVIHMGIGFSVQSSDAERISVEQFQRLASCKLMSTVTRVRLHVPMRTREADVAPVFFAALPNLSDLRLVNVAFDTLAPDAEGAPAAVEALGAEGTIPAALESFTTDAITIAPGQPNDTLRNLALLRLGEYNTDLSAAAQFAVLPRFNNLRTLVLRTSIRTVVTPQHVQPLENLRWLEQVVLVGDMINAIQPLSNCSRIRDLTLDYQLPHFETVRAQTFGFGGGFGGGAPVGGVAAGAFGGTITAPAAAATPRPHEPTLAKDRYSYLDLMPLTRMTQLRKLTIRGLGDLNILKASVFDGSFSLTRLEIVSCTYVTDAEVLAAVHNNRELQMVSLSDLPEVTNRGIAALEDLLWLRDLSVLRCARVTERGLIRVAERCRALSASALEAGKSDHYVAETDMNKLAARAGINLKFPDASLGYAVNRTDSVLI
jgi:hypothetical protein